MTARTAPYFPQTATGDGTTKSFALPFSVLKNEHLIVIVNGVMKTLTTDYSIQDAAPNAPAIYTSHVSGADSTKKHVVFGTAPTNGYVIKFFRNTPIARPSTASNPMQGPEVALYTHFRKQEQDDRRLVLPYYFNQTDLLAPTAQSIAAPCDGYIEVLWGKIDKAVTTGGNVTVEVDTVAVTGLSITVADADAAGTVYTDTPTTAQSTTTKVRRGQTITVTPGAPFATAGSMEGYLEFQPADLT